MTEQEIRERIKKCQIMAQEYREVNNTRRAKTYEEEIYKWEELLEKIKPIDQDYKRGYYQLQQRIEDLEQKGLTENGIATMYKERIDKAIEYIEENRDGTYCDSMNAEYLLKILGGKE